MDGGPKGCICSSSEGERAAKQHDARERRHAHRRGDWIFFLDFPVSRYIIIIIIIKVGLILGDFGGTL